MATKAEVISYLRNIPGMQDDGDDAFSVEVARPERNRSQLVFIGVNDNFLVLDSPFAETEDITAAQALDLVGTFGVSKVGKFYTLRHLILTEDVDESEILDGIRSLAVRADTLEEQVGGERF
jgi:hypothetical protein